MRKIARGHQHIPPGADVHYIACDCEGRVAELERQVAELLARPQARDVVRVERSEVETLPQAVLDEWDAFKADLARFRGSQEFVLPKGLAELVERVRALEETPRNITPAEPQTALLERLEALEELRHEVIQMCKKDLKLAVILDALQQELSRTNGRIDALRDEYLRLADTLRRATA